MELDTQIVEASNGLGDDMHLRVNEDENILTIELHNLRKNTIPAKLYLAKEDAEKLIQILKSICEVI